MENIEILNLKLLAKSWNNLDASLLKDFLSNDFVYESQWVLTPINGSSDFLHFLFQKFNTIRKAMQSQVMSVSAEIAYCTELANRPCLILTQITAESMRQVTVLIENKDDKISRIDICFIPDPAKAILTGDIPK